MRKKNKKLIIGVSFLIVLILIGVIFYYSTVQTFLPAISKGFTQYEGDSCGTYNCIYTNPLIKSSVAEFIFSTSTWKIVNSGGTWGSCGADSQGYIVGGCCTTTEVYKNGILIDTIKKGYGGTSSNLNTPYSVRVYCEDGTYDSCPNSLGIGVYPTEWGSTVGIGECNNKQHSYQIFMPAGLFEINTFPDNTIYKVGETIAFKVQVNNKLFPTKGKINIYYKVPTIFGESTRKEERDIDLLDGLNEYNFSLPVSEPSRIISITPELIVYYKTSNIKGVNYNFGEGKLQPINSREYFDLGTVKDAETLINITSQGIEIVKNDTITINNTVIINNTLTCKDIGCPNNYKCEDSGVCISEKTNLIFYLVLGVVLIIVILIFIYFITKKKRK